MITACVARKISVLRRFYHLCHRHPSVVVGIDDKPCSRMQQPAKPKIAGVEKENTRCNQHDNPKQRCAALGRPNKMSGTANNAAIQIAQ